MLYSTVDRWSAKIWDDMNKSWHYDEKNSRCSDLNLFEVSSPDSVVDQGQKLQ